MPTTTVSPTIYGKPMNKSAAKCAASFAGIGMQSSQIQINDTDPHATGLRNGTCDKLFWVDFNVTASDTTYPFLIHMPQDTTVYNHTMLMEHQIALDMMLASHRGLCVLFNHTCCTYIPDNVHSDQSP